MPLNLGHSWVFQQNNNTKHTSELVVEWSKEANIDLKTSPDLNFKENMCPCQETQI